MTHAFATLAHIPLKPRTTFLDTSKTPELVDLDSPAVSVMTQFSHRHPVTIEPRVSIDHALEKMKAAGVRLLFVVDEARCVVGLVTTADILGEAPVKIAQASGLQHDEITVEMVMIEQERVSVLDMVTVHNARVGHVIATLKELERRHLFAVEVGADTHQVVVGMFSLSEIGRRIGQDLREDVVPAHSLAELVQSLG